MFNAINSKHFKNKNGDPARSPFYKIITAVFYSLYSLPKINPTFSEKDI